LAKISVIRFGALGDCILLCPFLDHLKKSSGAEITVVTKRAFVELFSAARGVDRIVAIERGSGLRGLRQVVQAHRGDDLTVVDAHSSLRSRLVSAGLGGAGVRLRKFYLGRLGLTILKRRCRIPSVVERYGELGESLGLPPLASRVGGIDLPVPARKKADALLDGVRREIVCIAPGSRWPMKRWAVENYAELARRIAFELDYHVALLGDALDAAETARIARGLSDRVTDLAGRTGILETAAVIGRSVLFIGNDSGLMHLAEAVGVPVIALFGPTVEAFGYYPSLPRSKVIERSIPCRPCSRNGRRPCPRGTQECLTGIPVDWVEEALWDLVEERGPARYVHE
jgi:heptosyltransferase-2